MSVYIFIFWRSPCKTWSKFPTLFHIDFQWTRFCQGLLHFPHLRTGGLNHLYDYIDNYCTFWIRDFERNKLICASVAYVMTTTDFYEDCFLKLCLVGIQGSYTPLKVINSPYQAKLFESSSSSSTC